MAFIPRDKPSNFGPTDNSLISGAKWVPDSAGFIGQYRGFRPDDDPNRMVTVPSDVYEKTRFGYFRSAEGSNGLASLLMSLILSMNSPRSIREELEDEGQQVGRGVTDELVGSPNVSPLAIRPRRRPA